MRNISQKIFPVLRKLRKKIAQILRKRFSHFVETLPTLLRTVSATTPGKLQVQFIAGLLSGYTVVNRLLPGL